MLPDVAVAPLEFRLQPAQLGMVCKIATAERAIGTI
jgi:hypothetical protein